MRTGYDKDLAQLQSIVFPGATFFGFVLGGCRTDGTANESANEGSGRAACSEKTCGCDRADARQRKCHKGHSCKDTHWCANQCAFLGSDHFVMFNASSQTS